MKRLLVILIILTLLFSCVPAFAATSYSDLILSVLDSMEQNNRGLSGAPQQTANGAYRAVEMLSIMAHRLDTTGAYSKVIDSSIDTLNANNKGLDGAPQQTANGCIDVWNSLW